MMFWAADVRARRRKVVKGAAGRARAKMVDMERLAERLEMGVERLSKDFRVRNANGKTTK